MTAEALLNNAYLIPLAPLAAFALILAFRKVAGLQGAWIGVLALGYGLIHSLLIAGGIFSGSIHLPMEGLQGHFFESSMTWFSVGDFNFQLGVLIDGLSATMLCVVTLVSLLVQLYSISYMHDHIRFGRYFAYVNLFTFAMLALVLANNMTQFFIGWELMGLCSYLLIGFDFEREAAAYAGRKAFLTTRVGDLGMYIGLLAIFNYLGTFNIPLLHQNVTSMPHAAWVMTAIPLLLFCGAMGKSAQVPLHVWLPDAMAGSISVSALIHAATMVAAGVYMVGRVFFFFQASPIAMDVVAWVGAITAIVAASMGLVNRDIKRVLAFSTVSQLGFMMAALGCGGYAAGLFHLTTHAAFKALLFLCSGSVIHAMHTNDMWEMGGLRTKMPVTMTAYLVGTLAIAGCWPFAGFFSKEEVLGAALHHNPVIFFILGLAAFMTTFYMFRSVFLTFFGTPRNKEKFHHAHESPALILIPLVVLAIVSTFLGFFFHYENNLAKFLSWGEAGEAEGGHHAVMAMSLFALIGGFATSWFVYMSKRPLYDILGKKLSAAHALLTQRYKFDELYLWVIKHVYYPVMSFSAWFDFNIWDQTFIDGVGRMGKGFSWVSNLFDGRLVDGVLIDGWGVLVNKTGTGLRKLQSGLAQSYLFWMGIGLASMFVWIAYTFK